MPVVLMRGYCTGDDPPTLIALVDVDLDRLSQQAALLSEILARSGPATEDLLHLDYFTGRAVWLDRYTDSRDAEDLFGDVEDVFGEDLLDDVDYGTTIVRVPDDVLTAPWSSVALCRTESIHTLIERGSHADPRPEVSWWAWYSDDRVNTAPMTIEALRTTCSTEPRPCNLNTLIAGQGAP